MDLRHIRSALAVAEEMHFSRAADRLRVAQPSLSRQIRELEAELGVMLFRRTSRRVELTPAGVAFVESASEALRAVSRSAAAARAAAEGVAGHIMLGLVASAAIEVLPRVVRRLRTELPRVGLTLREMGSEQQATAVLAGEIDVGLTRDLAPRDGIAIDTLLREPLVAALPDAHPLRDRARVPLAELVAGDIVSLPPTLSPRATQLLESAALRAGVRVRFAQEANQYATLLALVAAETGVAIVPESVTGLRTDGLRYLPLSDEGAWSEVQTIIREPHENAAAARLHRLLSSGAR